MKIKAGQFVELADLLYKSVRCPILSIIVTKTKFSILIGSVHACLLVISGRSRRYPITGIQFEQLQIGYL